MAREYDELLEQYRREIAKYPLLAEEEVHELVSLGRKGNISALHKLIMCNQRLVIRRMFYWWNKVLPQHLSKMDLIMEGNCEFIRNILRFDVTRGKKFSTYMTYWIDHGMERAIKNKDLQVRVPVEVHKWHRKAENLLARLSSLGGSNDLDFPCLVRKYKDSKGRRKRIIKTIRQVQKETIVIKALFFPLDAPQHISGDTKGDDAYLKNTLEDESAFHHSTRSESAGGMIDSLDNKDILEKIRNVAGLTQKEEQILSYRFEQELLLKEIGQKLGGLSRQRIEQILEGAIDKLRTAYRMHFTSQELAA